MLISGPIILKEFIEHIKNNLISLQGFELTELYYLPMMKEKVLLVHSKGFDDWYFFFVIIITIFGRKEKNIDELISLAEKKEKEQISNNFAILQAIGHFEKTKVALPYFKYIYSKNNSI